MAVVKTFAGLYAALPVGGLEAHQLMFTTDRGTLHAALSPTTHITIVPAIDRLEVLPSISGAADFLIIHDGSEAVGQKEKKISVDSFKTALNIPAGSSDERVAVVAGGTAGYIWGTNGTDGVVRMNSSMSWAKDAGNGFVTLSVGTVDCGTF